MVSEEEGTVAIQMQNKKTLQLENVAYAPTADSNLVSLGQLREAGITFYDMPDHMLLKRKDTTIGTAKRLRNLFVLDTAATGLAKALRGRGQPTHLQSENESIRLWHRRYAHANDTKVVRTAKNIDGMNIDSESVQPDGSHLLPESSEPESSESEMQPEDLEQAETATIASDRIQTPRGPCVETKHTRIVVRHKNMTPATIKLEQLHCDLWGPHSPASWADNSYVGVLIDELTRKSWVLFLRFKDGFFDAFKLWLLQAESSSGCKLQQLRINGGGESISTAFKDFCKERSIDLAYTAPYMHEENGLAERAWRTISTMKDSMLVDAGLPTKLWAEGMDTANYLKNRPVVQRHNESIIPGEKWTGNKQDISHLRIFGSTLSTHIPKEKRQKSDIKKTWKGKS